MRDDAFSEESDTCQREHEKTWRSADKRARENLTMPMTAENIDRAHALTRASKFFFVPKVFETSKICFSLKIAAVQLSATTTRRRGALLMVHFARTLTVPLRLSRAHVFVSLFSLQRVENKLRCASWCDAPFKASHLFPFFPPPMRPSASFAR